MNAVCNVDRKTLVSSGAVLTSVHSRKFVVHFGTVKFSRIFGTPHLFPLEKMTTAVEGHKPHNQLLLFLENWFRHFMCTSITYSCLAVHYMLVPIEVPCMFYRYAFCHSYAITSL